MEKIRLIIADSRAMVRKAMELQLVASPCIDLIGQAESQADLLWLLKKDSCDIVVLGLPIFDSRSCAGVPGTADLSRLMAALGTVRVVLFADLASRAELQALLDIGVQNIVSSSDDANEVIQAAIMARLGMSSLSPNACELVWGQWRNNAMTAPYWRQQLSERELEVLRLYLSGKPVSQIARETGRNVTTISSQKKSVMRKMRVENDVQLAALSIQHGLL